MAISKIAHISDIHIRKIPTRNAEYEIVFRNLFESLKTHKPDRIVLVGDLVHDYLDLQGEQLILATFFLRGLAEIAPLIVTRGNHDFRKKSINRTDSIEAIVESMKIPNLTYYNETGFFTDENIIWSVWKHGDVNCNPWNKNKKYKKEIDKTYIDLYHNPINGCSSVDGFEMKKKSYIGINEFLGDYLFAGDIHKQQYLDSNETKGYCGSLIAQDYSEGDDNFHGYLLWDINNKTVEEISVESDYSFKNIEITPYIDFNDLDIEIDNPTKFMRVRFVWLTLSQAKNKENIAKLVSYIKSKYEKIVSISHKSNFIEEASVNSLVVANSQVLENISDVSVQHEVFKEYLTRLGCDEKTVDDVIEIDNEITSLLGNDDSGSGEWNIIKFSGKNFRSYADINIDWRDQDGVYQISGENTWGKTTIISLISYILYGKILETESKVKFGDKRFVNNRNNATFCSGEIVIESNGEYYGIQKRTDIKTTKDGQVTSVPTTTNYYLLSSPDDVMNDTNCVANLTGERKQQTQLKIDNIVGSYENFQRTTNTTADNLNKILSNDMATFIDSLLFDSGLDIFDRKLQAFKDREKLSGGKLRVVCNVDVTNENIRHFKERILLFQENLEKTETIEIPDTEKKLKLGNDYIEKLNKKMYTIDNDVYTLNIDETNSKITQHTSIITDLESQKVKYDNLIEPLPTTYDEQRLVSLTESKDQHKTKEYELKLKIKSYEQEIFNEGHLIELINGDIFRLKNDGAGKKAEIMELRESKVCPKCKQELDATHKQHIEESIRVIEKNMFEIVDKIKIKQDVDTLVHTENIKNLNCNINETKEEIIILNNGMELVLAEIGNLINEKNSVAKRLEYQNKLDMIPVQISNEQLKIDILNQKLFNYKNCLLQIEENRKIEKQVDLAKIRLDEINKELYDLKENAFIYKNNIASMESSILQGEILIRKFFVQEHEDNINKLYKQCVHRDGIPREMLVSFIIPKINKTIEQLLNNSLFRVWLDLDDLKPKLVYNSRPNAIVECIGSSGKERTFSSVILKFALNKINTKAKPTIFLLDEVMGKLTGDSIEEFIEVLNIIKDSMNKVIVIEHNHFIDADYILAVNQDENGISTVIIE